MDSHRAAAGHSAGGLRPPHATTFAIKPENKADIAAWIALVQKFIAHTASEPGGISDTKFYVDAQPQSDAFVTAAAPRADASASGGTGAFASSSLLFLERPLAQSNDVLEGITVQYAVHLTCNLGHYSEKIRMQCARLLHQLSVAFDKGMMQDVQRIDSLLVLFQVNDRGYFGGVTELFKYIGGALSDMAIALVAGLESFYASHDFIVRGICVTACTRLIAENQRSFVEEDNLAAIWNLYFSLASLPLIAKVFPDRLVIIQSFGVLAPLYTLANPSLAIKIVHSLLKLRDKTTKEVEAIKATLQRIFQKLAELKDTDNIDVKREGSIYATLLGLVNPSDEYAYDLLGWALENYTISISNLNDNRGSTSTNHLLNFLKALSNHFRATPSLVRYGASICLHTSMLFSPAIRNEWNQVWDFIINGVLDSDYLSSFLNLSIIESMHLKQVKGSSVPSVEQLLDKLRHREYDPTDYDVKYANAVITQTGETTVSDVLEAAISFASPLPMKVLNKMTTALEYMNRAQRLRQLELVRLWCTRVDKFDTLLMQTLLPLLDSHDEATQLATVKVIHAMVPTFKSAPSTDIAYAWSYFKMLLSGKAAPNILRAILGLVKDFPTAKLSMEARAELLQLLLRLTFYRDQTVRLMVYELIATAIFAWKSDLTTASEKDAEKLINEGAAMLLLSLGDQCIDCVKTIINHLLTIFQQSYKNLVTPFTQLRAIVEEGQIHKILKAFDDIANIFGRNEAGDLGKVAAQAFLADHYWNFFLHDVPENQLVRPDDYSYVRNFIHAPYWIALLLCKMGVPPPPQQIENATPRHVMPEAPVGRRRFICGFMLLLLPSTGIPDPTIRAAACHCLVRCCIRQHFLQANIMRGLLEYVTQQMLLHKQWTFQASGMHILRMIIRLKIQMVSPALFGQYADLAIDFAQNMPSSIVRLAALEYLETVMLVFPNGVSMKLAEIRDCIRALVVDKEQEIAKCAVRLYPLVFRCVGPNHVEEYYRYLRTEISTIIKEGIEAASDPLISKLSASERDRVVRCSIDALGALRHPEYANKIVQDVLPFLKNPDASFRQAALSSVMLQLGMLDGLQKSAIGWIIAPLFADPNQGVHDVFLKYLGKQQFEHERSALVLPPHPDDAYLLKPVHWEDVLQANAHINPINAKNLEEMAMDLDRIALPSYSKKVEDDVLHVPNISEKLNQRLQKLVQELAGPIPENRSAEVLYFLQELQKHPMMQGPAILVLSEFCCQHEFAMNDVLEIFLNSLTQDISVANLPHIEACIVALRNMSTTSLGAFKTIIQKFLSAASVNEGDLIALVYMVDTIKDVFPNKASELLRKYMPIVTSSRHTIKKRLYAIYLCVELSVICGPDDMVRILDAVQTFIDSVLDEEDVKLRVFKCLGKLLFHLGPKHSLFRTLITSAKKDLRSHDVATRLRSLSVFQIFANHLATEELVWFCMLYLGDPNHTVRSRAHQILVYEGVLEFIASELRDVKPLASFKKAYAVKQDQERYQDATEAAAYSGSNVNSGGVARLNPELTIPLVDTDPLNSRYYMSERRKKFSQFYGLPEQRFAAHCMPVSPGLLRIIEDKAITTRIVRTDAQAKHAWMLNIDPTNILFECMKNYPAVATDVIETLLQDIESSILEKPDAESGYTEAKKPEDLIERDMHTLDVLYYLLLTAESVNERASALMKRLQELVSSCVRSVHVIRESLLQDLENSFFFFNEDDDVPITSDEQYEAFEKFRNAVHESTMEILRAGKADKYAAVQTKRKELNEDIDMKSVELRRFNLFAVHATSGFGSFFAFASSIQDAQLVNAFKFLTTMLDDEHRGLRDVSVEAIVMMAKSHLDKSICPDESTAAQLLLATVEEEVQRLLERLSSEGHMLYRRKADMLSLIAQLVPFIPDRELRFRVLRSLINSWRDPDSEVRLTSIRMVLHLAEVKVPEIIESFHDSGAHASPRRRSINAPPSPAQTTGTSISRTPTGPESAAQLQPEQEAAQTSKEDRINLMQEIASLISTEEYPEKDQLNRLLVWFFDNRARV